MYRMLLLHYTLLLVKQHVFREKYRRPIILRYKIVRNYFQEIFFLFFFFRSWNQSVWNLNNRKRAIKRNNCKRNYNGQIRRPPLSRDLNNKDWYSVVFVRRLLFSRVWIYEPLYRLQLPYKMLFEEVQLMKDHYYSRVQFEHCTPVPRIERLLLITYL